MKTKQNKTKQNKTKQNKTKQNKPKQNKTKHNKTKQNKTKHIVIMVKLDSRQRVFAVKTYFETHSFNEVIRLFRERFPGRNPSARMTIWTNVKKYTDHARSLNRNRGNSGRRFTVRTQDTIDAVEVAIQNNPRGVTCRINGLGLTESMFHQQS